MKLQCTSRGSGWRRTSNELLVAPHPFEPHDRVTGCPECHDIGTTIGACDEDGCLEHAGCGTPTPDGYRWTCYKHIPAGEQK